MRFASITMILLVIHVSIAGVNATGIFHTEKQPLDGWFDSVGADALETKKYADKNVDGNLVEQFADFVKGLFFFITTFIWGVIAVPYTLGLFGLTSPWTFYFSIPIYLIYLYTIAQWTANRSGESLE